MNFAQTDEQRLLADSLRRLLDEENEFDRRRARLTGPRADRLALWPVLAENGMIGAAFDEAHGGFGGDARTIAVVMAELGRSLVVEPYLGCAIIAGRIFQALDDASERGSMIDETISGKTITVLAHDSGHDPFGRPSLSASKPNGDFLIEGLVRCVRHGEIAHQYLVTVMASDGLCILRVPRDAAGLTVEGYRLIDAAGAADLHFNQVRIDGGAFLRVAGGADAVLCEALDWGIFALVTETAGIVTTLNAATFRYLMSRKQFGSLLGSFQALQHRAADMHIAAEEVAAMAELAIEAMQSGARGSQAAIVSAAKVVADGAGRRIGHESVQMHGGMGVSDELNISHYARRLAAIRAQLGFADIHRLRFGAAR